LVNVAIIDHVVAIADLGFTGVAGERFRAMVDGQLNDGDRSVRTKYAFMRTRCAVGRPLNCQTTLGDMRAKNAANASPQAMKDFQSNWNVSYMKDFQDNFATSYFTCRNCGSHRGK
jgi:hypothetical protein